MKTGPSLNRFEALIAFVKEGSVAKAALSLNLTEAAISQKLKSLEEDVGAPLFAFAGRRKILTPLGKKIFELAAESTSTFETRFRSILQDQGDLSHHSIRIAGRREFLSQIGSRLKFPGPIEFQAMPSAQAIELLKSQSVDFVVTGRRPNSTNLFAKKILSVGFVMAVHESLVKERSKKIFENPRFLKETPCLAYRKDLTYLQSWFDSLKFDEGSVTPKYLCEDWSLLWSLVCAGKGYSILPANEITPNENVIVFEVPNSIIPHEDVFLIYNESSKPLAKNLEF